MMTSTTWLARSRDRNGRGWREAVGVAIVVTFCWMGWRLVHGLVVRAG
jgi:hypothetical protein